MTIVHGNMFLLLGYPMDNNYFKVNLFVALLTNSMQIILDLALA